MSMESSSAAEGLEPLSPRQKAALAVLQEAQATQDCPPTRVELGLKLGVSAQTADFHLRALERKGYVELGRNSRSVRLLVEAPSESGIPILGRVAAGVPILALENREGFMPRIEGSRANFALRVQGDSMIEAGILDGDLVLVEEAMSASRGEIVVALLGDGEETEATVKRYLPEAGCIVLHPENCALSDRVVYPGESFALAGRVVGVLRCWG
jgi:repressor LexA